MSFKGEATAMDGLHWPILGMHRSSLKEFVSFWEKLYFGYDEKFYQKNIGQPLTKKRIAKWFKWKNGRRLSAKKANTILRYLSPEERVSHEASADTLREFLNRPGGVIWRIFWLHLQHPRHFPIYDQHVHRAMAFMLSRSDLEIAADNSAKVQTYLVDYCPFFAASAIATIDRRTERSGALGGSSEQSMAASFAPQPWPA
jgi:hypothetical protein